MKSTKRSLTTSAIILFLCFSMLLGTTYAWFTDSASSAGNIIQSGNLDIKMHWSENLVDWNEADGSPIFTHDNWEPGYTEIKYIKVENAGNLSFKWKLNIEAEGRVGDLADVIDVYYISAPTAKITTLDGLTSVGVLSDVIDAKTSVEGVLLPAGTTPVAGTPDTYLVGETVLAIAFHMDEEAGNKYQNQSIGDGFTVSLIATQVSYESDAFGNTYDENAEWPNNVIVSGVSVSADIDVTADSKVANAVFMTAGEAGSVSSATIPAGVKVDSGVDKLTLTMTPVDNSLANVVLDENEAMLALDVHIDGIAADNDVVMTIKREKLLPAGLNMGNYRFYHVENGVTVEMTLLESGATPVHNNYEYDPATGDVVLYIKSFSVMAFAVSPASWDGEFDYSWYNTTGDTLYIANADQFVAFGAIVGGMAKDEAGNYIYTATDAEGNEYHNDSFEGRTVVLVADIDIGYSSNDVGNYHVFYPVGYYNSEETYERDPNATTGITSYFNPFEGTFDGNGNTIENIYQNTWDMKGDNDEYAANLQYYRDGMGLFGKVYGGTVKNLIVKNFSSDGEYTTTGVIAAYADCGATFENIAIFGCNPRVYNIGNGGIVGCVGWYAKEATDTKVTFKNITVDNTNKISALWGSWDVACGGIVGQYYPTSGQSSAGNPQNAGVYLENCHVAAQIDVYNDVCANYQYYAYRYAGMLIGSIRENETIDGHVYPKMDGITAEGCTVHFGDWNDYYYCELVANSLASYTHDHQMSRLEQVLSVDVANKKVVTLDNKTVNIPTSGRYNYVVVKAKDANGEWIHGDGHDYAECYHFVNGVQHFHDVADADNPNPTETVNGVAGVLKEDKQLIYREFDQLFTGYGWGVTSKGRTDFDGSTVIDVARVEQENSVKKFKVIETAKSYKVGAENKIRLGDLFEAVENVTINTETLFVFASPSNATYPEHKISIILEKPDGVNWEDYTITFVKDYCSGDAKIVITDFNYCIETALVITAETGITSPDDEF